MILSRFIADKMIIQQGKKPHIWGWTKEGRTVNVTVTDADGKVLNESSHNAVANTRFDVYLEPMDYGGPYSMTVTDDAGESVIVRDIMVGEVFVTCGQSNMEFPMSRVADTYPEEMVNVDAPLVREFKIKERREFNAPLEEVETGSWVVPSDDNIGPMMAISYFMARDLSQKTGHAVGYINASLGGSPIAAWMSEEMLEGYDDLLKEAERYKDDSYCDEVNRLNNKNADEWYSKMDELDAAFEKREEGWKKVTLPAFMADTSIGDINGCIWLRKKFEVPGELAGRKAVLWLGTLTDFDVTYVNGEQVGTTAYSYPPRRYGIREGLLHEGTNTVMIRLGVDKGPARMTPGKLVGVIFGNPVRYMKDSLHEAISGEDALISLEGEWEYQTSVVMNPIAPTVFMSWKPTALFNGMLAPAINYPVRAFMWYQGESDTAGDAPEQYYDKSVRMIRGLRELYKDDKLPYIFVKLPNFGYNLYEVDPKLNANFLVDKTVKKEGWERLRDVQDEIAKLDNAYMFDAWDYGEANDVHPQNKRPIGEGLSRIVMEELLTE